MRYIGLDLALTTNHKAIVMDDRGRALTPVISLTTSVADLEKLFARARESTVPAEPLSVIMEPTGMAWFPVAVFCQRHHVTVYVVNSQQVADLRRYYKRHAKSDRIDAQVLAKLPVVSPEKLHPLHLSSAEHLACQRGCKELARLQSLCTAMQYRLQAIDRFAWPGLETILTEKQGVLLRWFRRHWYEPQAVLATGVSGLERAWQGAADAEKQGSEPAGWAASLAHLAAEVVALYGADNVYLDYAALRAEVTREQTRWEDLEAQHHALQMKIVRPLYRHLHPSRNLETLKGVGQDGAAV